MALVQVSVFDAVQSISGRYHPVSDVSAAPRGASVEAAFAAATRAALLAALPSEKVAIDADYQAALQPLPEGPAKADGIAAGERAASAVLALRAGDGSDGQTNRRDGGAQIHEGGAVSASHASRSSCAPPGARWNSATSMLGLCVLACLSSCGVETPLQPANRSPVVQSLIAFPSSISPGDSAVVVCHATDSDGDPIVFDWTSDCRLIKQGASGEFTAYSRGNALVVYAGACADAPLDTGWVSCHVRDRKGGGANAGTIRIVIRQ